MPDRLTDSELERLADKDTGSPEWFLDILIPDDCSIKWKEGPT